MSEYNVRNWFWRADDGRVFSSAIGAIVPETEASFAAFMAAGGVPTAWPRDEGGQQTAADLQWVFDNAGVRVYADPAAYANMKQWALATGGFTLTLSGQALTFATDTSSQSLITGKYLRLAQANPPTTIQWQFPSGFVSISAGDFAKAASAIADFIQATFDQLAVVLAAIKAGTITTVAQIDAAAWPSAVAAA